MYMVVKYLIQVSSVRMPRHVADKRVFCGTALIEFSMEEDTENVLKQSLIFRGVQLELKLKYAMIEIVSLHTNQAGSFPFEFK